MSSNEPAGEMFDSNTNKLRVSSKIAALQLWLALTEGIEKKCKKAQIKHVNQQRAQRQSP